MTLSYQLTFEEYREAHAGGLPKKKKSLWRGIGGWVLFLFFIGLWWLMTWLTPRPAKPPPPVPPGPVPSTIARFIAGTAPTVAFTCLIGFLFFRHTVKPLPKPWESPLPGKAKPSSNKQLVGWLIFIGLAVVIFFFLDSQQNVVVTATGPANVPRVQTSPFAGLTILDFLPGIFPWFAMFMMLILVSRAGGDRNLRRAWDAQPFLQRPETLEVDANGMSFAEPMSRRFYTWSFFPGFKETPSLFLIYVSPMGFFIIPKRAFVAPGDLNVFRGYLLNEIRNGQFLDQPAAFPVVPLARVSASPPPLPAVREPVDRV